MIDIKWIRQNPDKLDANLIARNYPAQSDRIISLDAKKRNLILQIQELQQQRNQISSELSRNKHNPESEKLKQQAIQINKTLNKLESEDTTELDKILDNLPNILDEDVPQGQDENDNKQIRSFGAPKQETYFKDHQEMGHMLGAMDFKNTAKISGTRFVTLSGDLAKLERALVNFLIDYHVQNNGFYEILPPYIVKHSAMYNAGQLPKFAEDSFRVEQDFRLIPTAEVPLVNLVADQILSRESLPIRLVAYTHCFRSEAGSAGKDTKGLIRMHQFSKVELVSITTPEESKQEHELILHSAQKVLEKLELPYRTMLLCSGDTGFASSKTYDIEVWLPSQKRYREISSCSNCKDFQARRLKARYKEFGENQTKFLHTLNGSALPLGRTIAAILENYQNPDDSVTIPNCLIEYMGGQKRLDPKLKL